MQNEKFSQSVDISECDFCRTGRSTSHISVVPTNSITVDGECPSH